MFYRSVSKILRGDPPPSGYELGQNNPALLGLSVYDITPEKKKKKLLNNKGEPLSYKNFTDKKQNGCYFTKKHAVPLCVFCIELSVHLPSFKVQSLQMTINFALVEINISSRHLIPT